MIASHAFRVVIAALGLAGVVLAFAPGCSSETNCNGCCVGAACHNPDAAGLTDGGADGGGDAGGD